MPSPRKVSPSPSLSASTSFLNERSIRPALRNRWGLFFYSASRLHARGQPQRDDREGDQDDQPDQVGDDEGQYALEDGGEFDVLLHALDDEDDHSDRGVDQPELNRHDDDDSEPERNETKKGDDREEEQHGQDD